MTRIEAHAYYRELAEAAGGTEQKKLAARRLCLGDLFYLMVYLMGRRDMDNDWLYARCREVEAAPDGYLDLWAREHYKSTIITIGKTIQDILGNPDIRVGIFSHSRPIAKSFLRQIKREFESNRALQGLFPHICPPQKGQAPRTWSEDAGLVVKRGKNSKEATVEAWGLVDGQPTGKHFDILVFDDVVTRESVHTPEQIAKTTEAWQLALSLGSRGGQRRIIGTRYHFNDSYATILRQGSAKARVYAATADGLPGGEPVLLSREALAEKRRDMGAYVFACQMLQNPKADSVMGFKAEWLRYWQPKSLEHLNRYILVDPAGAKKKGSDYTCIWVVGLGADGFYYLIDGLRDRFNLSERAAALFRLHRKYRPIAVGYERYGMQADIEHIRYLQEQHNYRFGIIELGGQMPKADRIRRLMPLFEQGRIYLPARCPYLDVNGQMRDITRDFVDEEYLAFPVAGHDDMLDALARILDPALGACFPEQGALTGLFGPAGPPLAEMEWNPFGG